MGHLSPQQWHALGGEKDKNDHFPLPDEYAEGMSTNGNQRWVHEAPKLIDKTTIYVF